MINLRNLIYTNILDLTEKSNLAVEDSRLHADIRICLSDEVERIVHWLDISTDVFEMF